MNAASALPDVLASHPALAGGEVTPLREQAEHAAAHARQTLSPAGREQYLDGAAALLQIGRDAQVSLAWLAAMPDVVRECGEDVMEVSLGAAMKMASMTSAEVIAMTFRTLPDVARELGDAELLRGYMRFLHQLSSTSARGLRPMLGVIDELLEKLTLSGLKRWAAFGTEAYRRDYTKLTAYFGLESPDSKAVLKRERRGVLLNRVQRKLQLYLVALWGRDFLIRPLGTDDLEQRPKIESAVLYLPDAVEDEIVDGVSGLDYYRASAAHMAAHLVYTSEPISAAELSPAQCWFISLFEDARVEHRARAEFPGVGRLWRALLAAPLDAAQFRNDVEALASAELLRRCAQVLDDPSHHCGDEEAQQILERWLAAVDHEEDERSLSWRAGLELFHLFSSRRAVPSLRLLERSTVPYRDDNRFVWQFEGDADDGFDTLGGRREQVRRKVSLMEFINEVDNELAGDDAEEIWTCSSELFPYEDDLVNTESFNAMWGKAPVSEPFHYDEWDYQMQMSRPDWVTLREHHQPLGDPDTINAILSNNKPIADRIRHIVDKLAPAGVQRLRNRVDGDEIDINAAIDAMIAIRSGEQPSSRITMRNVLKRRDLAVVVLMDLSESTNDLLAGELPASVDEGGVEQGCGRRLLDLTREAATLVATAIEGIGDNFALHGFASDGREDVRYYRFKQFGERFGIEARARLAGMRGGLSTRMGAALRHAAHHLARQSESRRLILLITDGEPADIDVRDPRYLREDTKRAVDTLRGQGIHTYCLTLDASADRYVRGIFGDGHYTVIDQVERLPERLPLLFAALTR